MSGAGAEQWLLAAQHPQLSTLQPQPALPGAFPVLGESCGVCPLPELEVLAAAEQGLSCCLVTAATFQKCPLFQPASQTNKAQLFFQGHFPLVLALKKKKERKIDRGKKSLFQPQPRLSSPLSVLTSGPTKGSSVPCPGAKLFHPPLLGVQPLSFLNSSPSGRELQRASHSLCARPASAAQRLCLF